MTKGQRILFNAIATYGRTLLAIFLGLFSSRWILEALGDIDYGLMGVVGGILVFITFLNSLSSSANARFFAYSVGQNNVEETQKWFNTALSFEAVVPAILVILGFFIGEIVIKDFLSIPPNRLQTALWVFRFSLVTALVTMICSPFMAMYTAKQNIAELSFWGMGSSLTTFVFSYILTKIDGNRWLIYGAGISVITCLFYILQSVRSYLKYAECKINFKFWFDKQRLKEMTTYSVWTLFGALGGMFYSSGTGIILNKFFPPLQFPSVNASYSIGITVRGHTQNVSSALLGAFMPEIMSSEGRGDRAGVIRQMFRACRLSYIIISIVVIPLLIETEFILKVWLVNPPEYACLFCRVLLIGFLISRISGGFDAAICATGKIRNYQIIMSSFAYMIIGLCALILWLGGGLYWVCATLIGYNISNVIGEVIFGKKLVGISVKSWIKTVVIPVGFSFSISLGCGLVVSLLTSRLSDVLQFFVVTIIAVIITSLIGWILLTDENERIQCKRLLKTFMLKAASVFPKKNTYIE